DDEAGERAGPVVLHRLGHGRGGLAGAEHDRAALGRRRQMGREDFQRIDGADGGREQALQDVPIVGHGPSLCPALYGAGRSGQVEGATGLGGAASSGWVVAGLCGFGRATKMPARTASPPPIWAAVRASPRMIQAKIPEATGLTSRLTAEKAAGSRPRAQEIMPCPMIWLIK